MKHVIGSRYFVRVIFLLPVLVFTGVAVYLSVVSYETFTYTLFARYGELAKLQKFRQELLTEARFAQLRGISVLATVITSIAAYFGWRYAHQLVNAISRLAAYGRNFVDRLSRFWQRLPVLEKYAISGLLLFVGLVRAYFLFRLPFHIDERFSYLYFVSKGLGVSLAYYPNPNNHILYTLLCWITHLFVPDPELAMKLPAFLLGLFLVALFWLMMRRWFDACLACTATVLFAFSGSVFYYGTQGRGYTLLLIFVVLLTWSAWRAVSVRPVRLSAYAGLWLSSTLGLYTIPIFLYPFAGTVALTAWMSRRDWVKLRWLVVASGLVSISVGLLYLPVFLVNGWNAISGNAWVAPLSWSGFIAALPGNLTELSENAWGSLPYGTTLTVGVLMSSLLLLAIRSVPAAYRFVAALLVVNVAMLIAIVILQRIVLFSRVIVYLNVWQYPVLAIVLVFIIRWLFRREVWRRAVLGTLLATYVGFNLYAFHQLVHPDTFSVYDSFDRTANLLYARKAGPVFVSQYEYSLCIRFQFETNGRAIDMDTNEPVPGKTYAYLVIHRQQPFPTTMNKSAYRMAYEDPEVLVYERIQ